MKKIFYIQKNSENIITDVLEFAYEDYVEVELDTPLPHKIMSGCYKLVDKNIVYVENLDNDRLMTKISTLKEEKLELEEQLGSIRSSHSDLLLDLDFRVMDIEDMLEIPLMNVVGLIRGNGMNSTFMVVLDKIETGNYSNKQEIVSICDKYLSRNRINEEEYAKLIEALEKKELEKTEVTE